MKKCSQVIAAAAILGGLVFAPAIAQVAAAAKTPAGAATAADTKWSCDSLVGDLLDYAPAKAVLIKHVPAIGQDDQIEQARGMSFRSLQQFAPDSITDSLLAAIDADLAKLPSTKAGGAPADTQAR